MVATTGTGIVEVALPTATECRDWVTTQNIASFRGIEFAVDADLREGGRRIVAHEYPGRETWDNEDMGRARETARVRAYVFGDDADLQADKLFAACSEAEPAYLSLPFRANGMARCVTCYSTFEADRMGRFSFELEFAMEAPYRGTQNAIQTRNFRSVSSTVTQNARGARSVIQETFDRSYNSASVPALARDAASSALSYTADQLDLTISSLALDQSTATSGRKLIKRLADDTFGYAYSGQRSARLTPELYVSDQLTIDSGLSTLLIDIFKDLTEVASDPELPARAIEAMFALVNFSTDDIVEDDSTAASVLAERDLVQLIGSLIRQLAILATAEVLIKRTYRTRQSAVNTRSRFSNAVDREIEDIEKPDVVDALQQVSDAVVNYLTLRGAQLPSVIYHDATMAPASVIAYRIYNDVTKDDEILSRNSVPHPLFVTARLELIAPDKTAKKKTWHSNA